MENNYIAPGPIFEPGLGWGGRLKKWSKKYILGGDCALCQATRYVLVFGIVVIIIAWPKLNRLPVDLVKENLTIAEIVQPKDGKTQLARRILAKYLNQNNLQPSNAQKVFLETVLKDKISDQAVEQPGNKVELSYEEIEKAIGQAMLLSPFQMKKWETFSQRVSF